MKSRYVRVRYEALVYVGRVVEDVPHEIHTLGQDFHSVLGGVGVRSLRSRRHLHIVSSTCAAGVVKAPVPARKRRRRA
jgi:hypothetical protein